MASDVPPTQPTVPAPAVSGRGRLVLGLLLPQVVLGWVFFLTPERTAFLARQAALLLHVTVAVATVPVLLWWLVTHTAGRRFVRPAAPRGTWLLILRYALVLGALAAFATGGVAAYSGRGTTGGWAHAVLGLGLGLPLVLHLLAESRRRAAFVGVGAVAAGVVVSVVLRAAVAPAPLEPETPAFTFEPVKQQLYDPSRWCGECHVETYREWSQSLHARNMKIQHFRENLEKDIKEFGLLEVDADITHVGSGKVVATCISCHAPETFHSDDTTLALESPRQTEEGVSCVFCHTVRGYQRRNAVYLSAPQTVRRYLGQASENALARQAGNWLIRWMPETHAADYSSPFLASSEFCFGCHGGMRGTYVQWRASDYAKGHPPDGLDDWRERQRDTPREAYAAAVQCQDCHMAERPTAPNEGETGSSVAWRPPHARKRHHLFPGGNVGAAQQLGDPAFAALERTIRGDTIRLRIDGVARLPDAVEATVTLESRGIGHSWPSGEGAGNREPYVQLRLLDAAGTQLAATTPPKHFLIDRTETDSPRIQLLRDDGGSGETIKDTSLPPNGSRTFVVRLKLAAPPPAEARVVVEVHASHVPGEVLLQESAALPPAGG